MNIEERLVQGLEFHLPEVELTGNVTAQPGTKHILTKSFVVQLPDVNNCKVGTLIGIKQLFGTGTVIDRYSHYTKVGSINHNYKVPENTEITIKLMTFAGHKRWIVVSKKTIAPTHVNPVVSTQPTSPVIKLIPGPKGEPGEQGPKGDKGDHGIKGDTGPRGKRGYMGYPGDKGDRGPRGIRGLRGFKGEDGKRGPKGKNANYIEKIYIDDYIYTCRDMYRHQTGITYRFHGNSCMIKNVYLTTYLPDTGKSQPIVDILVTGKPLLLLPHRLPNINDSEIKALVRDNFIIHDGDIIQIPTIEGSNVDACGLLITIEFQLI